MIQLIGSYWLGLIMSFFEVIWVTLYCTKTRLQYHPHCGVVCGPHYTVRTAPTLKAQKFPHNHNFPTINSNLFYQIFWQKKFLKQISRIFFQSIEKKHKNELCGWCAGADNTTLKKAVVVRSAQPHQNLVWSWSLYITVHSPDWFWAYPI